MKSPSKLWGIFVGTRACYLQFHSTTAPDLIEAGAVVGVSTLASA